MLYLVKIQNWGILKKVSVSIKNRRYLITLRYSFIPNPKRELKDLRTYLGLKTDSFLAFTLIVKFLGQASKLKPSSVPS
jgi:hypothetical protein